MEHTYLRVYSNGFFVKGTSQDLLLVIDKAIYDVHFRPGCAVWVNSMRLQMGHLSEQQCRDIEVKNGYC